MLGAQLEAIYPMVPLLENMGLGVALMSYDGKVCWGFNADYELVPDLPDFVELVQESFREVQDAVRIRNTASGPRSHPPTPKVAGQAPNPARADRSTP